MPERYEIICKVVSVKGECSAGHKVGDEWVISSKTPEGICLPAFAAFYPDLRTLMFGGSFPWGKNADSVEVVCPDPQNPVIFELRRLRK